MTDNPRFLQIHTITPFVGALLNRDQSGQAKRLTYGDAIRTRVSSQCLKRHWRMSDDDHAISNLAGEDSVRSRHTVATYVTSSLSDTLTDDSKKFISDEIIKLIYGERGGDLKKRQVLLLGRPEIDFMVSEAQNLENLLSEQDIADIMNTPKAPTAKDAKGAWADLLEWRRSFKQKVCDLREQTVLPSGITGALFGRMVTSDKRANITAPIHVAHAFTTHEDEIENDYFVAVDDLNDIGTATIQDTEINSGLFYGYVVIDIPLLLENCGFKHDPDGARKLASQVVHNLVYLIAEVSPGAKLGSTAPYGRPVYMLTEAGRRQPRSLGESFRKAVPPQTEVSIKALVEHLGMVDAMYGTGEERRAMCATSAVTPGASETNLPGIADFAKDVVLRAQPPKD
jgi:CRISPR system Cascade subunit CasC